MGRTDDIINVAGHRLSTGQMEQIVAAQDGVAECAVIGADDAIKGMVPIAFVAPGLMPIHPAMRVIAAVGKNWVRPRSRPPMLSVPCPKRGRARFTQSFAQDRQW
jgi:acyl-coenzyme A synthetase/AMP-(fatty) acid ligase